MFNILITETIEPEWKALPKTVRNGLQRKLREMGTLISYRAFIEERYGEVNALGYTAQYAVDTVGRRLEVIAVRTPEE